MSLLPYTTDNKIDLWYKKSSIKNYPRRMLIANSDQYFFPIARQPLAIHPLVDDCGEPARRYILTQTAYRYLFEIAIIETECVNQVALNIANGTLFPVDMNTSQQALSIIVDEAYHAYVALDAVQQIEENTRIPRLNMHNKNPVLNALQAFDVPEHHQHYKHLQFVAVCLSEHVLTQDLVLMKQEHYNCDFFNQIMTDHLIDEGMHASFFSQLLTYFFHNIDDELKRLVQEFIPVFMLTYLNLDFQKQFEKALLMNIGLSSDEIIEVLEDTYYGQSIHTNPAIRSFLSVLNRTKILTEHSILYTHLCHNGLIIEKECYE